MDFGGFNWSLITIVGAVVLAVVIAIAAMRNRRASGDERDVDNATRRLYDEEDAEHRGESDNVP